MGRTKKPDIKILTALYGTAEKHIEVATRVRIGRKISNRIIGEDPCPKKRKTLSVVAMIDGNRIEKVFNEGDKLIFIV